jgi:hypothetical protein
MNVQLFGQVLDQPPWVDALDFDHPTAARGRGPQGAQLVLGDAEAAVHVQVGQAALGHLADQDEVEEAVAAP